VGDLKRRAGDRFVTDAARVHVGLVRQVHEVVDHEAVVALETVKRAACTHPLGAVVPMEIRKLRWIGECRIAWPQPDQTVSFDHRISMHAGRRIDGFLRRHVGATAGGVEYQPMIPADDLIPFEMPKRKRQQAVPARILKPRDLAVAAAVEHHVLLADRPGRKFVLDFVAPSRGIPGVQWKRLGFGHGVLLSTLPLKGKAESLIDHAHKPHVPCDTF
jgi:hypothetical protein